jgi:hypothetical protein
VIQRNQHRTRMLAQRLQRSVALWQHANGMERTAEFPLHIPTEQRGEARAPCVLDGHLH